MIREARARIHRSATPAQRALEKLSEGASHTLVQVTRRLGILDQEYGFIRTTIFWVRDQEPVGLFTLTQGAHEFNVLVKGLVRLAKETVKPSLWGQPSGEFVVDSRCRCLIVAVRLVTAAAIARRADQARSASNPGLSEVVRSGTAATPAAHSGGAARTAVAGYPRRQHLRDGIERENAKGEDGSLMRALRSLALGLARAATWPLYLISACLRGPSGPWPRSLGILVSAVATGVGDRDLRP